MDKVEKFKELLYKIEMKKDEIYKYKVESSHSFINRNKWIELFQKLDKELEELKEQLIKMYEDLNENNEKPVIRCEELYVNINQKYGYEIQFINLKNHEVKTYKGTLSCKEKDGMLITDDFIFVKE